MYTDKIVPLLAVQAIRGSVVLIDDDTRESRQRLGLQPSWVVSRIPTLEIESTIVKSLSIGIPITSQNA